MHKITCEYSIVIMYLSKMLVKYIAYATERFKEIGASYQLFEVVCLAYYIISFILWPVSSSDIMMLRFISVVLYTGLIFFHYFDKRIQKLLPFLLVCNNPIYNAFCYNYNLS